MTRHEIQSRNRRIKNKRENASFFHPVRALGIVTFITALVDGIRYNLEITGNIVCYSQEVNKESRKNYESTGKRLECLYIDSRSNERQLTGD